MNRCAPFAFTQARKHPIANGGKIRTAQNFVPEFSTQFGKKFAGGGDDPVNFSVVFGHTRRQKLRTGFTCFVLRRKILTPPQIFQ